MLITGVTTLRTQTSLRVCLHRSGPTSKHNLATIGHEQVLLIESSLPLHAQGMGTLKMPAPARSGFRAQAHVTDVTETAHGS